MVRVRVSLDGRTRWVRVRFRARVRVKVSERDEE